MSRSRIAFDVACPILEEMPYARSIAVIFMCEVDALDLDRRERDRPTPLLPHAAQHVGLLDHILIEVIGGPVTVGRTRLLEYGPVFLRYRAWNGKVRWASK